jgi:drug/metabolite transporter (DMT)-like permease
LQQASFRFKAGGVWLGTALLTVLLVTYRGEAAGQVAQIEAMFWGLLVVIGLVLCASTLIVQYGLTHLPANQAIVLFLFELVVAAGASWGLADEAMGLRELIGALLIVSASLLSGRLAAAAEKSTS